MSSSNFRSIQNLSEATTKKDSTIKMSTNTGFNETYFKIQDKKIEQIKFLTFSFLINKSIKNKSQKLENVVGEKIKEKLSRNIKRNRLSDLKYTNTFGSLDKTEVGSELSKKVSFSLMRQKTEMIDEQKSSLKEVKIKLLECNRNEDCENSRFSGQTFAKLSSNENLRLSYKNLLKNKKNTHSFKRISEPSFSSDKLTLTKLMSKSKIGFRNDQLDFQLNEANHKKIISEEKPMKQFNSRERLNDYLITDFRLAKLDPKVKSRKSIYYTENFSPEKKKLRRNDTIRTVNGKVLSKRVSSINLIEIDSNAQKNVQFESENLADRILNLSSPEYEAIEGENLVSMKSQKFINQNNLKRLIKLRTLIQNTRDKKFGNFISEEINFKKDKHFQTNRHETNLINKFGAPKFIKTKFSNRTTKTFIKCDGKFIF